MTNELMSSKFSCDEEVIEYLKNETCVYEDFLKMKYEWKRRFIDFCIGKKTLPILYDEFFKMIFHPDIHPDRLSSLISSLIGEEVCVKKVLPLENCFMHGERMIVMDILVEAQDGSLANVEVQKNPYRFTGERISCYSSDIVTRQYSRIRSMKGKDFSYKDLKKVYTIVIYEKTEGCFHKVPEAYIHRGKVKFDTGLQLELLQDYCLIALDVFKKNPYHKEKDTLTGWLSFLTTEGVEDAERLIEDYPWLLEIY
ncbi:MAG: PD-(D/E)XK nuclease family transposase [Lachnospiraceae bacterium]